MTIGSELFDLLSPLVNGRMFATWADSKSELPYIVYTRLQNSEDVQTLTGEANIASWEYEITAWAAVYDEAEDLGGKMTTDLRAYKSTAVKLIETQGRDDLADPDTLSRGSRVRCLIYTTEV